MKRISLLFIFLLIISCGDIASGNKGVIPEGKQGTNESGWNGSSSNNETEDIVSNSNTTNADSTENAKDIENNIANNQLQKKLTWTAFKMPEKVGVSGTFSNITLSNVKKSDKLEESLEGATFVCSEVASGDRSRDQKLKTNFFTKVGEISGSFGKFSEGKVPITIKMNKKSVIKEFTYTTTHQQINLKGSIDILKDFNASEALDKLNKACYDLHLGKTWSDVDIDITISK